MWTQTEACAVHARGAWSSQTSPLHPLTPVPNWQVVPAATAGPEEPITVAHIVVKAAALTADISHAPDVVGKLAQPHGAAHAWFSVPRCC